jgi:hypothetical protein
MERSADWFSDGDWNGTDCLFSMDGMGIVVGSGPCWMADQFFGPSKTKLIRTYYVVQIKESSIFPTFADWFLARTMSTF